MRSNCLLCGASFADVARATARSQYTLSGRVASNRSWCADCDSFDAAVRVRAIRRAEEKAAARARGYKEPVRDTAPRRTHLRQTFRCTGCGGRFGLVRQAFVVRDGRRHPLGVCQLCKPDLGRAERRRQQLAAARKRYAQSEKGRAWRKAHRAAQRQQAA